VLIRYVAGSKITLTLSLTLQHKDHTLRYTSVAFNIFQYPYMIYTDSPEGSTVLSLTKFIHSCGAHLLFASQTQFHYIGLY